METPAKITFTSQELRHTIQALSGSRAVATRFIRALVDAQNIADPINAFRRTVSPRGFYPMAPMLDAMIAGEIPGIGCTHRRMAYAIRERHPAATVRL